MQQVQWKHCQKASNQLNEDVSSTYHIQEDEIYEVFATIIPYNQHHLPHCREAKEKEIKNLQQFNTYEEINEKDLNNEQKLNIIRATWVIAMKEVMQKTICKARLCARGDEETLDVKTDSPTVSKLSERIFLSICASKKWKGKSLDFTGAFLQGKPIDREVIIIPPKDYLKHDLDGNRILWKVNKRMYGFKDASRGWWLELDETLTSLGMVRSIYDKAVYLFFVDGVLEGVINCHVDDLNYGGESIFHETIIDKLVKKFVIGRIEDVAFTFIGWDIRQDKNGITVSQNSYLEKLKEKDFTALSTKKTEKSCILDDEGQAVYRSAVGCIGWLAQVSRPDLSFSYVDLSTKAGKATVDDGKEAFRIISKAKENQATIRFANLGDLSKVKILAYYDASHLKNNKVRSYIGDLIFLQGINGCVNIIDWSSQKLQIPAASPLAAECESALEAYGKVSWVRAMWMEFLKAPMVSGIMRTDSKSLESAVATDNSIKDKKSGVAIARLRAITEFDDIQVQWVRREVQWADLMTKSGGNATVLKKIINENSTANLCYSQ